MDIGVLAAFLGGTLALLSPCGALLLPAFFASRVGGGVRLALHGLVFYVGVAAVLVPLGAGAGTLGRIFATHREALVMGTAALLVVMGVAQALGWGFDLSRVMPGTSAVQSRAARTVGITRTFLLGLVGGVAGFCAGPILGAILTVAAIRSDPLEASALLALYSAGIVVPMIILAAMWERLGPRGQALLRGRTFVALGKTWHTTSLVTGVLMIALGMVFWTTNGLASAPSLVPVGVQSTLQTTAASLDGTVTSIVMVLVVMVVALIVWHRRSQRRTPPSTPTQHDPAARTAVLGDPEDET